MKRKCLIVWMSVRFSPPRVSKEAKSHGLKEGFALDLITGWDFNKKSHRDEAIRRVREEEPTIVIGSPPCTMFSILMNLNKNRMDSGEWDRRMKQATMY